jgi:hypothetical protein
MFNRRFLKFGRRFFSLLFVLSVAKIFLVFGRAM